MIHQGTERLQAACKSILTPTKGKLKLKNDHGLLEFLWPVRMEMFQLYSERTRVWTLHTIRVACRRLMCRSSQWTFYASAWKSLLKQGKCW